MLEPAQFQAFYQVMRSQIEHEDNLVTQRLSWFITSQSFLFTAYAILLNGPAGPPDPLRSNLMHLIPLLAILVCILILSTIAAGLLAMKNLRQHFRRMSAGCTVAPLPPVQGSRLTALMGQSPPAILPVLFLLVWVWVLGHA